MKLIRTAIFCTLVMCLPLLADQVITAEGRIILGKAAFTESGEIQIAGQTIKKSDVRAITFGSSQPKSGLSDLGFRLYQGNWDKLPDFTKLAVDKSGTMTTNRLDLSPLEFDGTSRIFNLRYRDSLSRWSAPPVEGRPFTITATVEVAGNGGVLLAHGGNEEGYALYLNAGKLHFATRHKRVLTVAVDELPFPFNQSVKIVAELRRDMNLVLHVDGREAARAAIPGMISTRPKEGLSVGFDQRPSLVGQYRNDHYFQGEIKQMKLKIMGMGLVYSGKLNVVQNGNYKFELIADATARLEINQQVVSNRQEINLPAGPNDLRLTYAQLNGSGIRSTKKHMSLHWSGPEIIKQPLTAEPHPQTYSWHPDDTAIPSEGTLTADGSFLARPATDVNRTHILLGNTHLERKKVGALFMRPLSIFETRTLVDKPAGVLLMDGTFTEGKLLRLDNKTVTVSSILFGLKKLKRGLDAVAVVINPTQPVEPKYSILLRDGSHLFGQKYSVHNNQLELPDHPLEQTAFPLSQVTGIFHGHKLSHVELAEKRWESHSQLGQQCLGERTQRNMKIIIQFREAQFKLAAADKSYAKAIRTLPAAEKTEAAAKVLRDAELPKLEAPKATAKNKAELHNKTVNDLNKALREQEASCTRDSQAFVAYNTAIHSRRYEALKSLAQLQIESMNLKPDERKKTAKKIEQAANKLKKVNQDIQRLEQTHLAAQTQTLASDMKETTARQAENEAWKERTEAQTLLKAAMEVFNAVEQNYQAAKFTADQIRNEISRSKRDSEMAKGKIGILAPSLQTTFHP